MFAVIRTLSTDGTSVSLTGSRSPDDRRRRRLAVAGDGADVADLDAGGIGVLRERIGDLPSASPWLPREPWKRNTLAGAFWVCLTGVAVALLRPLPPHPQIAPAVEHLTQGARPILSIYIDIILWTLAGQFAAIIGWYRSHSLLDFQGRYRVWAWAAMVLTAWGFFAGTSLHTAVAAIAGPQLRWPLWRAETVVWLIPAALAGLSVWWLADRDLQRSRLNMWLVRSSVIMFITAGLGELFARDMNTATWFMPTLTLCHLVGAGLLVTGLWFQAWFVAYVSADPPDAREPINWSGYVGMVFGWVSLLGYLWPFRWKRAEEVSKPKRRTTKKKDEEDESEEDTAPKRRRKTAAKTKRATKPRTRVKPEPEEVDETAYDEEEATDESWEESDESAGDTEDEWTEEHEEEEPPAPPARPPSRSVPAVTAASKPAPPPAAAKNTVAPKPQPVQQDEDDGDDDDDSQYRVDSGESGSDMFKGLSKRQRRELRKQMKDKERQQR